MNVDYTTIDISKIVNMEIICNMIYNDFKCEAERRGEIWKQA